MSLFASCLDREASSNFDWTMYMLRFNFILGLYFIFFCFGVL